VSKDSSGFVLSHVAEKIDSNLASYHGLTSYSRLWSMRAGHGGQYHALPTAASAGGMVVLIFLLGRL
jgi:hypothetical protein